MNMMQDAELYDLLHRGHPGDVAFYRELCLDALSVLELGCGTGRMLSALAREDLDLQGIDLDQKKLAFAREKLNQSARTEGLCKLIRADMTEFSLGQKFDRVIMPYNSLYCLLTEQLVLNCFQSVRQHLQPEGLFCFDVYAIEEGELDDYPLEPDLVVVLSGDDCTIDVWEQRSLDIAEQRFDAEYIYQIKNHDGGTYEVRHPIPQRFLYLEQLEQMLISCGLEIERLLGDFDGETFSEESPHMIVVAGFRGY